MFSFTQMILSYFAQLVSTIKATIVRELQAFECWLRSNSLFLNVTKTEAMLFGTSQRLAKVDQFSVSVNGSAIKRVTEFKFLGVVVDEHLSWNEHVKAIVSKAGRQVGMLGCVRRYITTDSANAIFLCMIRLTLEYCAGVWGCCGEVNSGTLETLQKRVGRIIVIKTSSSDTALKALKWPSLRSRCDEHALTVCDTASFSAGHRIAIKRKNCY